MREPSWLLKLMASIRCLSVVRARRQTDKFGRLSRLARVLLSIRAADGPLCHLHEQKKADICYSYVMALEIDDTTTVVGRIEVAVILKDGGEYGIAYGIEDLSLDAAIGH